MPNVSAGPGPIAAWYRTQAWRRQRERVIARDGGQCRACGRAGRSVQHLIPLRKWMASGGRPEQYPDDRLVTLCVGCHGRMDGGRSYP